MNPSREQVNEVLADMARHLRMDPSEGAAFGAGFHEASVISQAELKQRRTSAYTREYDRLTITEAPRPLCAETSWHEDDDYAKHDQRSVWTTRRCIVAALVITAAIAGVVLAAIEIGKWIAGVP